jgi:hypothetical protein
MDRKLELAKEIAKRKNLRYETLEISDKPNKRFSILNDKDKKIYFGVWPYQTGTYIDHKNRIKRDAWYARHFSSIDKIEKIKKDQSALYFAALILW